MRRVALLAGGAVLIAGGAGVLYLRRAPAPAPVASAAQAARTSSIPAVEAPAPPPKPALTKTEEEIFGALATERDPKARRALVDAIEALPDPVRALRRAYREQRDAEAREETLKVATRVGDRDAVGFLVEVATTDEKLGAVAGFQLGGITSPRAAPALRAALASDGPVIVRANAARALGAAKGDEAARALTAAAIDAGEPLRVRQEAALALEKIADPAASPELAAALDRAADDASLEGEQLRIALARALAAACGPGAAAALARHARRDLSPAEKTFSERAQKRCPAPG